MKVEIKFGGKEYAINVTETSYDLLVYGTVTDKNSKNFGNKTETNLGYCTSMSSALNKLIRSAHASNEDVVDLKEYVLRIERAVDELKSFADVVV